jgi:hypothetical protein
VVTPISEAIWLMLNPCCLYPVASAVADKWTESELPDDDEVVVAELAAAAPAVGWA